MVIWWLCWHRTILIRNITQKTYSPFPPVHDFGKPWWGVAYVPCMTNLRALCARVIRWHVTCMLSLAEHWQGRRALSNHDCAHSVISMWHVVCLQHLARACSEQSRLTTVLPINHVIQMPQCLSGFVNHDYWTPWRQTYRMSLDYHTRPPVWSTTRWNISVRTEINVMDAFQNEQYHRVPIIDELQHSYTYISRIILSSICHVQ